MSTGGGVRWVWFREHVRRCGLSRHSGVGIIMWVWLKPGPSYVGVVLFRPIRLINEMTGWVWSKPLQVAKEGPHVSQTTSQQCQKSVWL